MGGRFSNLKVTKKGAETEVPSKGLDDSIWLNKGMVSIFLHFMPLGFIRELILRLVARKTQV